LNKERRKELRTNIRDYINSFENFELRKIENNKISFDVVETFDNTDYVFNSKDLSDGFLRIITLLSLLELKNKNGIFLIDEIENGLNPHLVGNLVNQLLLLTQKFNTQIIITTHNHIFVNYVPEDYIVFMWKNDVGKVFSKQLFKNPELKKQLQYLNTGDIWVNLEKSEIMNYLND